MTDYLLAECVVDNLIMARIIDNPANILDECKL
jgi:hypothetical protein